MIDFPLFSSRKLSKRDRVAIGLGALECLLGVIVLVGWFFEIDALKTVLPGLVSMKVNTALGHLVLGLGLVLRILGRMNRRLSFFGLICGVFVLTLGAGTLVEYYFEIPRGFDEWLMKDSGYAIHTVYPGRMAANTAIAFVLASASLLIWRRPIFRRHRISLGLVLGLLLISFMGALGYLYGARYIYGYDRYAVMALHTVFGFLLYGIGFNLTHSRLGLVSTLFTSLPSGSRTRMLLIAAVLMPVIFGWIRLQAQLKGWLGLEMGLALYAASNVIAFSTLVLWTGRRAVRDEKRQRRMESDREHLLDRLKQLVEDRTRAMHSAQGYSEAILKASGSAIIATREDGIVTVFNPSAERLLGYRAEEVVGLQTPAIWHDLSEVVAGAKRLTEELKRPIEPGFEVFVTRPRMGEVDLSEWTFIRKDGERIPGMLTATALRDGDGKLVGFLGVVSDLRAQKSMEQSLRRSMKEANAANRAKSEFLAVMSHEIRTPMNGVLGFSQLLQQTPLTSDQREYVETINQSGNSLMELINDILDYSKIEAGAIELECREMPVEALISEVVMLFTPLAREKGIFLESAVAATVPEMIMGDPPRVKRILVNLVGNALKFTERGTVSIQVDRSADSKSLNFRVSDTGVGIPVDRLDRLFKPFSQVDASTTRKYGGTGLGLSICRGLVEKMGGEIRVDSAAGKGSVFSFYLPLMPLSGEGENSGVALEKATGELPKLKILVAEDNPVNRRLVELMLEKLGQKADFVEDGVQAMKVLESKSYEALLLDIHMPEMNGFEVAERVRSNPRLANLKIIAITASVLEHERAHAFQVGMDAFLAKPLKFEELREELMKVSPFRMM